MRHILERYFAATERGTHRRKGGPLAVTDANLVLGRLVPDYFPKIFGKSEKEPLDIEASLSAFESLSQDINASVSEEKKMSMDEIVYGYVLQSTFSVLQLTDVLQLHQGRE